MATKKKVISKNAKGKKGSKIAVPKKKAIIKKSKKTTVKRSNIAKKKKVFKKPTSKKQTKKIVRKKVSIKKIKKKTINKIVKKKLAAAKKTKVVVKKSSVKKAQKKRTTRKTMSAGMLFVGNIAPYQPKKTESYMSKGMLKHFRLLLETWKQELMEKADLTMNQLKDEAVNYADPNDRASQEEGFNLELRARDRERKLIRKIEETLDLIDSSEYGFCKECGEEIGLRRLEARPTAALCVDCKMLDEIKEKQTGV